MLLDQNLAVHVNNSNSLFKWENKHIHFIELLEQFKLYNLHVFLSIIVLGAYKEKKM